MYLQSSWCCHQIHVYLVILWVDGSIYTTVANSRPSHLLTHLELHYFTLFKKTMATIPIRHGILVAASTAFIPVCTFVVGLRFYTRRVQQMPFKIDDWLTIPALVSQQSG